MSKVRVMKSLLRPRPTPAVEEIRALEGELSQTRLENDRLRKRLFDALNPEVRLHRIALPFDVQKLLVQQKCSPSLDQEKPEHPHIKEEGEAIIISQEVEQLYGLKETVKSENAEVKVESTQLRQSDKNTQTELPSSISTLIGDPNVQMRIHTGARPFSSSLCNTNFTQHGKLMDHMRINKGERPFTPLSCLITRQQGRPENMAPKRKSYSAEYKLRVVKYASEHGNRAAGREFGVSEKLVRDWRKAEVTLTTMKKTKKANRGQKARWPQLEERVCTWVLEQRAAGRRCTTEEVRLYARVVAQEMNIDDFAGGPSWCFRFMQRNRLLRTRTTVCQKLSADFQAEVDSFREFIEKHVTEHSVTPDHIINMDEVSLTFDIPMDQIM